MGPATILATPAAGLFPVDGCDSDPGPGLEAAASGFRKAQAGDPEEVERWCHTFAGPPEHAELFRDIHRARPQAAERLAQAVSQMPEAGTNFQGFRLEEELGRGAFGRVFLARQGDLAGRPVVLKVAADIFGEAQALAQLQHTNIVPVYSIHRCGALQAVCMPFMGPTTLADLLKVLQSQDRLPISGTALVSTLHNRKNQTRREPLTATGPASATEPTADATGSDAGAGGADSQPPPILAMLEGLNFVRAVLWVVTRLADGLAHAHEHGILHRDLKPANILLSNEGQPMLLDFGVAEDTKLGAGMTAAMIGGTLPYMSPEHLAACRGGGEPVTAQSDTYSLGVILYELLTGRPPFPAPRNASPNDIARMIADRSGPVPDMRRWNQAITPAVESIVRRCLHPDPAKRYPSARHLQEDLHRHLQDLPLRHAPEPSLRERARKWARRHPRLTSTSSVAALAGAVILGLAAWGYQRGQRLARLEALESYGQFQDEVRSAQMLLNDRGEDRRQLEEGVIRCRRALDHYGVLEDSGWQDRPAVRHLPADEQGRLREDLAELLLLLARATSLNGPGPQGLAGTEEQVRLAMRLNEQAAAVCPEAGEGRALWAQRAELARLLGNPDEARGLLEKAGRMPLRTVRDRYLAATELSARGRYREALPLLQGAVDQDPQNFWAWFAMGNCQSFLAQSGDAVASYNAAVALWPKFHWAYFNRGLVHLRQQNFVRAAADLDQAVRLRPDLSELYLNRAIARQGLKDYPAAVADLTRALDLDPACTRAYFMRARTRGLAGDAAGAKRDLDEGMRHEPTDEHGWVARGLARVPTDLPGALEDFDKALEFNPRSLAALQNKGSVLGRSGRAEDAARVLDRAVALYPDFVPSRAGRGVYLARQGKRAAALEDARESLRRDTSPSNLYQVAGIYALTSHEQPDDRLEAFRLLSLALRQGFGFDLLETDRDLGPVRDQPEFKRLVEAARSVRDVAAK